MIRFVMILLAALTLTATAPRMAAAHALDPGYLDLTAIDAQNWRVTWRVPDVSGKPMTLGVSLPAGCTPPQGPAPTFDGRAWVSNWITTCPNGLTGGQIAITGLDQTRTDALVHYQTDPTRSQTQRLTAADPAFVVPAQAGMMQVFRSYLGLGVTHILEGIDHLLFVFALILLVPTRRQLFWAVTAFTFAHSITLTAASLGWLTLPPPPVEAVIALSIVFLAYELALPRHRRDGLTQQWPWLVSFGFGLIHGLQFAGALREIGLPESDIPAALLAFNLGVEMGQLLFIAVVLIVMAAGRRLFAVTPGQTATMTRFASYGIGSLAAFWVIERMAGF